MSDTRYIRGACSEIHVMKSMRTTDCNIVKVYVPQIVTLFYTFGYRVDNYSNIHCNTSVLYTR